MTRRERLERKLEKRTEWAEKADTRSNHPYARLAADDLRGLGACSSQVALFARVFPDSVTCPDVTTVQAALRAGLNVDWLALVLAPAPLRAEYKRQCAALWAERKRQCAALWAECERQCAPLLAKYERQCAALWAECERQRKTLWAEYKRQRAALWAEYKRQRAPLWAEYDRQHATLWAEHERQHSALLAAILAECWPVESLGTGADV